MLNLEEVKAGTKYLETRDGQKVKYIDYNEHAIYSVLVEIEGNHIYYPINGKYNGLTDHSMDLICKDVKRV